MDKDLEAQEIKVLRIDSVSYRNVFIAIGAENKFAQFTQEFPLFEQVGRGFPCIFHSSH